MLEHPVQLLRDWRNARNQMGLYNGPVWTGNISSTAPHLLCSSHKKSYIWNKSLNVKEVWKMSLVLCKDEYSHLSLTVMSIKTHCPSEMGIISSSVPGTSVTKISKERHVLTHEYMTQSQHPEYDWRLQFKLWIVFFPHCAQIVLSSSFIFRCLGILCFIM